MKLKDAISYRLAKEGVFVAPTDSITIPTAVKAAEQALYNGQPLAIAVAYAVNQVTTNQKSRQYARFLVS